MKKKVFCSSLILLFSFISCMSQALVSQYEGEKVINPVQNDSQKKIKATIIYDNYLFDKDLEADWGFSVLLEGLDKTIMFDTGTKPEIFRSNFNKLGLDASDIDEVFISHEHGDHYGGLHTLFEMNNNINLVIPETFSGRFIEDYIDECPSIKKISTAVKICDNLYSSGVLGTRIPEQALIVDSHEGLVVITGCSHPGIVAMLREIKSTFGKNIHMVFGGFHLMNASDKQMEDIIDEMKAIGIEKCGATHCTGERQINLFRQAFGNNFVEMGAGNIIDL